MKMRLFSVLPVLLGLMAPLPVVMPVSAQAQMADHTTVPLAVIRFNQPRVYFHRPLANAVRQALRISPEAGFNVVNYAPGGDSAKMRRAQSDLQGVLQQLYGLGVRPEKVTVQTQIASGLPHSEVHLYVR